MKNIHVLPTDKYSDLVYSTNKYGGYFLSKHYSPMKDMGDSYQNIYITSDEEIKEGDWYWLEKIGRIGSESGVYKSSNVKVSKLNTLASNCQKIILTTDHDLIQDDVQAIDDEFLEWFVKNPSCEKVEVERMFNVVQFTSREFIYKIIIPKEETKLKNICIKCGVDLYTTEGRFTCQQSECRGIIVSKETLQEWADEEERKRHLIEIMKGDEELGVYDMSFGTRGCMYCEGTCNKECLPKQERVYEEPKNSGKTLADMKCSCLRYVPGSFSANCRNCGLSPRTDNYPMNRVGTFCDKCRQVMCQCKPTQETKLTFMEWICLFRWIGKTS